MRKQNFFLLLMSLVVIVSCTTTSKNQKENNFVRVENGQFIRNGKPYYYIGTNFWYGAILGSEGEGGNRVRLCRELDSLKSIGIDNLRILVGSDGERGVAAKVEPTLQVAPGVYNDTTFAGLDYLLAEMAKRDMLAVLYLNNSWEWSGGYGQYLQWAGYGKAPQYNPQIQISVVSGTKRSIFRQKNKTKRSKKRLHTTLIKPEQKVNEDLCSGFIVS